MQTLIFKMLLRKRGTAGSILAIALLVAILTSTASIVNYMNRQAETMGSLLHAGETFIILSKDSNSPTDSKVQVELAYLIGNATDTRYVLPQKILQATLITASITIHTFVRGVDVPTFLDTRHARINGSTAENMQANVGELLARLASIDPGDPININVEDRVLTVEVAGIVQTQMQSDAEIIVPMNVADSLSEDNTASIIEVALSDSPQGDINELRKALPPDVTIMNTKQTQAFIQDITDQTISFFNLWSIAVYATVAAASFVVATRLTIESGYELAMLRALGGKRAFLFKSILSFTFIISLLSSLLGLAIGLTGAQMISTVARWTWRSFGVTPFLQMEQATQIVLFVLTASTLGSIHPATGATGKSLPGSSA